MPKLRSRKAAALKDAIARASSASGASASPSQKPGAKVGRIMYIECKAGGLNGIARIGRVSFSKTGQTLYYRDHTFQSLKGAGFKSNTTAWRQAKTIGYQAPSGEVGIGYMALFLWKLMTMLVRSIGVTSGGNQRKLMR